MPIPAKYQYIVNQFAKIFSTLDGAKGKTVEHVIDHLIPDFTGENRVQREVLRIQNNTLSTTTNNVLSNFVTAQTNEALSAPEPEYQRGDFTVDPNLIKLTYTGQAPRDIRFVISGLISSDSTANDDKVGVRISNGAGTLYTGSAKIYPSGTTLGGASTVIGFTTIGFGRLDVNDEIHFEISKNFNGTLVVENCILSIEPLL